MISYNIINNIVIRKKERIRDTDKVIWDPWRNCNYCRSGRGWGYSHTGKTIYLKDTNMEMDNTQTMKTEAKIVMTSTQEEIVTTEKMHTHHTADVMILLI